MSVLEVIQRIPAAGISLKTLVYGFHYSELTHDFSTFRRNVISVRVTLTRCWPDLPRVIISCNQANKRLCQRMWVSLPRLHIMS